MARQLRFLLVLMMLGVGWGIMVPASVRAAEPVELRVMTFNIWLGGDQVNFPRVVDAIEAAKADIVGVQEAQGSLPRLAAALGWPSYDERMQIVSRYPLIDPPGADGRYVFAELAPGQVVALANVHLPSDPYGPYELRDGASAAAVDTLERETRLPALEPVLEAASDLAAAGIPVFLTGDFNAPMPSDWTAEAITAHPEKPVAMNWPVGAAALEAGFVDSYRVVHPDPVARPGFTWTPGYPLPTVRPGEIMDRIDLVLALGEARPTASRLVGEPGGPDVDLPIGPWPSDHRAVVSTFDVTPGAPPVFVAVEKRRVIEGDTLTVRFHAPGEAGERIALHQAGAEPATGALMTLSTAESVFDGSVAFGTTLLPPDAYAASLLDANGDVLATSPFWVLPPNATPQLLMERQSFAPGEPIAVAWTNAPGARWDWIGVYNAGEIDWDHAPEALTAGDPALENYLAFRYTGAEIVGGTIFTTDDFGDPLPPGNYVARMMSDDGYVLLAELPFRIEDDAPGALVATPVS